jgi:predicted MFS family arabinose efflux permease
LKKNTDQFHSPYRFVILGTALAIVFAAIGCARFAYTMLLPSMEKALIFGDFEAGVMASANLAGYMIISLVGGFCATRFGIKKVIVVSLAVVALSLCATGLAVDYNTALLARFFTGLGSAGANVPVMALVARWFGERERGFATGVAVSGTSIGVAVSGLAVPVFVSTTRLEGLGSAWMFFAILTGLIFIMALAFLKEAPHHEPRPAAERPRHLVRMSDIIMTRGFRPLAIGYFLYGFSYIIYATFFVKFLIGTRGFNDSEAGNLWFVVGIASIASGLLWGLLSDKIGRTRALFFIFTVLTASYALFGLVAEPAGIYTSAILFALCSWSVPAVMAATTGDMLDHDRTPLGFGMLTFSFGLGQALGPSVAGFLAEALSSKALVFLPAAAGAAIGAVIVLFTRVKKTETVR